MSDLELLLPNILPKKPVGSPLSPLRISSTGSTVKETLTPRPPKLVVTTDGKRHKRKKQSKRLLVQPHIEDFEPDLVLGIDEGSHDGNSPGRNGDEGNGGEGKLGDIIESPIQRIEDDDRLLNGISSEDSKNLVEVLKNVSNMASLLLDTRKALRSDYNIVDNDEHVIRRNVNTNTSNTIDGAAPTTESTTGVFAAISSSFNSPIGRISNSTRNRAEKVKAMIGVHYLIIQRYAERREKTATQYSIVDAVYNPVQTIRNRTLRAKYREFPKPLTMKAIPLASNMFSSHNLNHAHKTPGKEWKMVWAVEVQEKVSDFTWQHLHWHELRKSNGDLWFPQAVTGSSHKSGMRQRLHDRLFAEGELEQGDQPRKQVTQSGHSHKSSSGASTKSKSLVDDVQLFVSSKHPPQKIFSKKRRSIGRSGSSENELDNNGSTSNIPSLLKDRLFKKIQRSSDSSNEQADNVEQDDGYVESGEVSLADEFPPPSNDLEGLNESSDSVEILNINDVSIKPIERATDPNDSKVEEEQVEDVADQTPDVAVMLTKEASSQQPENVDCDIVVSNIVPNYHYLDALLRMRTHYTLDILPHLLHNHHQDVIQLTNIEIPKLSDLSIKVNDDLLPEYEGIYNGLLNEIQTLIHMINEDYSIRIDNLLSNSDRLIGEISTSLSLEMRKFNERIDRLNSSMFGSRYNIEMNLHKERILQMSDSNFAYYFLENFIIILLRLVWVVVNIYKMFRFFIIFLYKFLRLFTG